MRKFLSSVFVVIFSSLVFANNDGLGIVSDEDFRKVGVSQENIEKASGELNEKVNEMLNMLTLSTGMSKEAILDNFVKELPDFIDALKKDNIDLFNDYVKKPKE